MSKPNGFVIYRGPSVLDGKPIVVVATGLARKSTNEKTGELIQTWIIREDVAPVEAIHGGADSSVCGGCQHRGEIVDGKNVNRSCYVLVFQAPQNVWNSYHRGIYPTAENLSELFAGRKVRLGSYGDPAAVPMDVWHAVLSKAASWTGYSHQWREIPEILDYCMASADSAADRLEAKAYAGRTFRVRNENDPVQPGEIVCPASKEAGFKSTCFKCTLCQGKASNSPKDIVIIVHGSGGKAEAFARRTAA